MPGAFDLNLTIEGDKEVARRYFVAADMVGNFIPAFNQVANEVLYPQAKRQFRTQGRGAGAARWQPLAASTAQAKRRRASRAGIKRSRRLLILVDTGRLRRSVEQQGGENIFATTSTSMAWGTRVPYLKYHQSRRPRRKLPRRPVFELNARLKRKINTIFTRHVQRVVGTANARISSLPTGAAGSPFAASRPDLFPSASPGI